ncbi:MAG: uroporphyrinogen-III synthase [Myxococcales bacterium]|nr:uroporphyrinogen-III synthase [Myxococcales bacterium]
MPSLITIVGGGDAPFELLAAASLAVISRADAAFYEPGVRPALLSRLGRADILEAAAGEGMLPPMVIDAAAAGNHVAWLVKGDAVTPRGGGSFGSGDLAAARNAARERGVMLEVLPGCSGGRVGPPRPLEGKRVAVTRPPHQAGETCTQLARLGAEPVCLPTVEIVFEKDLSPLEGSLSEAPELLVVTSANAVTALERALSGIGRDARLFASTTVCAIGPGTARALERIGLRADVVASDHRAEGLLEVLPPERVAGARVLLPRAEVAREILPDTLRERGAAVDLVPVYQAKLPPEKRTRFGMQALRAGEIDAVMFTSASTVRNFAVLCGDELATLSDGLTIVAIGPVTAEACEELGLTVAVQPASFSMPALIQALVSHYARSQRADEE